VTRAAAAVFHDHVWWGWASLGDVPRVRARPAAVVAAVTVAVTAAAVALLIGAAALLGVRSAGFAFAVVWLPMTWMGTLSRVLQPRLPGRWHALRPVERDGRLYERLGVRVVKRLLRRGPLAVFNPDLHLPAERTPEAMARLDGRMRDAEAAHVLVFALTLVAVAWALARGWWASAAWILLFDVLVNGCPVMLQRYNRALLTR